MIHCKADKSIVSFIWIKKEELMGELDMKTFIRGIEGNINMVEHGKYLYWCPKVFDKNCIGFNLYAYGGWLLSVYMDIDNIVRPKELIHDKNYYSYVPENICKEAVQNVKGKVEKFKKANYNYKVKELFDLKQEDWDIILSMFKSRACSKEENGNKKHLERMRQTAIARKNENGNIKIIEIESRMKDCNKKPDMIGIRKEGDTIVLMFIEYKCTEAAMNKDKRPLIHFQDMVKYYNHLSDDTKKMFQNYERCIDDVFDTKAKGVLSDLRLIKGEMVFLFSHVNCAKGVSKKSVLNSIEEIKKDNCYKVHKDNLKFILINDENETLDSSNLKSLEEFETLLNKEC